MCELRSNLQAAESRDDCSPCQQLNWDPVRNPELEPPVWVPPKPDHQKPHEIMSVCCLKLPNFGVICHIAIDNECKYTPKYFGE